MSVIAKTVETELGIDNSLRNPAYTPMILHKNESPTWIQITCHRSKDTYYDNAKKTKKMSNTDPIINRG
jgi:hypothetical protein